MKFPGKETASLIQKLVKKEVEKMGDWMETVIEIIKTK